MGWPKNIHRCLLAGVAGVLVVAIGLVVYGALQTPARSFTGRVADLLPPPPDGWTRETKAIAETPEIKNAVTELLNYTDALLVDYTKGHRRVSVYVAYWEPGRMSPRLVAGHTPDVCWVGNGWKNETAVRPATPTPSPADRLMAQERVFSLRGQTEYVWYWHLVGNRVRPPAARQETWQAEIADMLRQGLGQRQEQFFIRISSNEPFEPDLSDPMIARLLLALPQVDPMTLLPRDGSQRLSDSGR